MDSPKWWNIAVPGVAVVLAAILLLSEASGPRVAGGILTLAAFVVAWFTLGRRGGSSPRAAAAFVVIVVLLTGTAVAFFPLLAILQAISYPLVWVLTPDLRRAIVANAGVAVAVGIGFLISVGTGPEGIAQTAISVLISFVFSMAMGLWISSIARISDERGQLVEQLTAAQAELETLGRAAGAAGERERLSREVHDTIAQSITGLVLQLQQARQELRSGDTAAVAERLRLLEEGAREALVETRALVAATAPVELTGGGLVPALERIAARFERETGIRVDVRTDGTPDLPREAEVVLLRCAQEALANVRKHAGARSVTLGLAAPGDGVRLEVRDDGTGFDPAEPAHGFGLAGMRDRLALADGSLDITSGAGGTTLTVRLPGGVRA